MVYLLNYRDSLKYSSFLGRYSYDFMHTMFPQRYFIIIDIITDNWNYFWRL